MGGMVGEFSQFQPMDLNQRVLVLLAFLSGQFYASIENVHSSSSSRELDHKWTFEV